MSKTPDSVSSQGLSAKGARATLRGTALLGDSVLNKGTAFTERERDALGLRGLLPPRVFSLELQEKRALAALAKKPTAIEKYIYLTTLQSRNETLFYRLMTNHAEEMIPLVYTPTVGQACLEYGQNFRRPRGLFISIKDRGRIAEILRHWPITDVRMIVVTDGERILGLGDLGVLGMGIPVGKLALYSACAGLHPSYCLPIALDAGIDNDTLRNDPFYLGMPEKRIRGDEYDAFLKEFVEAVKTVFPKTMLQWEDFGNTNAFRLLNDNRSKICSFNDDIQGTAAVALAGVISALRLTGGKLEDQKLLFLGAGEAGTGIADLYVAAAKEAGLTDEQARARCWFVDSQGLVVKTRPGRPLAHHKLPYAHDAAHVATLAEAVDAIKPTILIGVSGQPKTFTEPIVRRMGELNKTPIIFALSNPTSQAEAVPADIYAWTNGRAIVATGSPFAPVKLGDKTYVPGQGNNVYIFPGVGLGALACEATEVTDSMFLASARTLASLATKEDLATGRVYPALSKIREVSLKIAVAVAEKAYEANVATLPRPANLETHIAASMFQPEYYDYV